MMVMVHASLALEESVVSPSATPLKKGMESLVMGSSPGLSTHIVQTTLKHKNFSMPNSNNQVVLNCIPQVMLNSMFQKVPNSILLSIPLHLLVKYPLQMGHIHL
jgi:hypothetical protein